MGTGNPVASGVNPSRYQGTRAAVGVRSRCLAIVTPGDGQARSGVGEALPILALAGGCSSETQRQRGFGTAAGFHDSTLN